MKYMRDKGDGAAGLSRAGSPQGPRSCAADLELGFSGDFTEVNPFRNKAGIRRFRELYTGKRRKDRKAWADYFLSEEFLEGYREEAFAELMLETVRKNQQDCPPGKEFLTELCIVYGLQIKNSRIMLDANADFRGMECIVEIIGMGTGSIRLKGNDLAVKAGFQDYRELLILACSDLREDDVLLRLGKILDRYRLHNISDRPVQNGYQYEMSWRHPGSLRLITYFFRHTALPEKVYRLLWNHLRLDTATNGREKLLYGELRETAMRRVQGIGERPRNSYKELLREFYQYDTSSGYFFNEGKTPEEQAEIDCFFERKEVQDALMDEAFVEEQVLTCWITKGSGKYLIEKLQNYYSSHGEAPYAKRILEKIAVVKEERRILEELLEDEREGFVHGMFDFQNRAYVRYYLNTAFHLTWGVQNRVLLGKYLEERMPCCAEWSRRLTDPDEGGLSPEHPVEIYFEENVLSIRFHPGYMEYRWNDSPIVPPFQGEELAGISEEPLFWLLAPIAEAPFEKYSGICGELMRRLSMLPVCREDIPVLADCIAGRICRAEGNNYPVCSLYREKGEKLFGCDIYGDEHLELYEETTEQKIPLPGGVFHAPDPDSAVRMGERMLEELTSEEKIQVYMEVLPTAVLVRSFCAPEKRIRDEQVTEEEVNDFLRAYFEGQVTRLELVFSRHSLLFLGDQRQNQYTCFFFDHGRQDWYALVSLPEIYATVESEDVNHVPFGMGYLPDYLIHTTPGSIRRHLPDILAQIACPVPNPRSMMWSPQIYRFEMKLRYHLAKRLYGGYPSELAQNQLLDRFYLPHLPAFMSYSELDGTGSGRIQVQKNKAGVQNLLFRYMQGQLGRLTLSWQPEKEFEGCHIVLVQDAGCHQMFFLNDAAQSMEYLVSDVREYLDAEGKKYRKTVFRGKTVPGCLVHTDLRRIRDSLDVLIPQILEPSGVLGVFGEFAYEKNGQYEQVREEYV